MDTDFHKIFDERYNEINQPQYIHIGNNVWTSCQVLILKGVEIPSGNIIAANTTITKSVTAINSIIGGNPTKILKENITWKI